MTIFLQVVDDYGVERTLKPCDDGTFEGTLTIDGKDMPYWLPSDVVGSWPLAAIVETSWPGPCQPDDHAEAAA